MSAEHGQLVSLLTLVICQTVTVTEALVLRPLLEDRGRITESICILVPVDRMKQKMFSDHDETSPSIAAVSAPSVACSMLAVQQQKRLCCLLVYSPRYCLQVLTVQ